MVSGAAIGIDGAAHRGALAVDGPTVAVLACGIDRAYPTVHERLITRIAATGLVLSEYPPGCVPARHRFLVRNRLIAGLAEGTLVIEAGLRSGAQRTAADARALGRVLMALPGPVTSGCSAGCHRLIRDGAVLVTRAEEVLEGIGRIGVDLAPEPGFDHSRPTDGLDPGAAGSRRVARPGRRDTRGCPEPRDGAVRAARGAERRGLVEHRAGSWQRVGDSGGGAGALGCPCPRWPGRSSRSGFATGRPHLVSRGCRCHGAGAGDGAGCRPPPDVAEGCPIR